MAVNDRSPMTEDELALFLKQKIGSAMNDEDGEISDLREEAYNYYVGKPYGNERPGRSKVTTREVYETVEWILPSVLRVFMSGDRFVEFEPEGEMDEEQAAEDTDVVNHILLRQGDGFAQFTSWAKDALMYPNGYAKVWAETRRWKVGREHTGLSLAQKQQLEADGWECIREEQRTEVEQIEGVFQPVTYYDCFCEKVFEEPKICWKACPGDEVLVDPDLNSWNLDEADFVAHRRKMTFTDLVQMGIDPDDLEHVSTDDFEWNDERVNRQFTEDENPQEQDTDDDSMQTYWVHECYVMVDFDGDGLAERRRVLMIGGDVFQNDPIEDQPFCSMSSVLMSHRHPGLSMADAVMDLQLIKSTLTRQVLDNIYRINTGKTYIDENFVAEDTYEKALNALSNIVPVDGPPSQVVMTERHTPISAEILNVIRYFDEDQVIRTGVAPNLSLDPKTLQQSTEGAYTEMLTRASERIELIIRTFAETGVKQLCQKTHKLARRHIDRDLHMRLGHRRYAQTNPANWREREAMVVNVGLGNNTKERQSQLLMGIYQIQKELLPTKLATPANIHHTLSKLIENADIGSVSHYLGDVAAAVNPSDQPDPAAMAAAEAQKAQVQLTLRQQEHLERMDQLREQRERMDLQLKAQEQAMNQRFRNMELQISRMAHSVEQALKFAQTAKTAEETRALDIENDAAESGVTEALEGLLALERAQGGGQQEPGTGTEG